MSSEQSEKSYYCKLCKKQYQTQEMLDQHYGTNKHKKNLKKNGRRNSFSTEDGASSNKDSEIQANSTNPFDAEFVDKSLTENSKIEEPRKTTMDSLRICLFCNESSQGVKKNLDHMRNEHSFYVLDIDCLISLKALLHYLAEKVHTGHCCINCNKQFVDAQAAQNHMKAMCHCCMNSDSFDDEYEYFYDFSPTYEEGFVGKKLDDFDLTEEPLAKPISEKIFSQVEAEERKQDGMETSGEPMNDIVEEDDGNDEEWEDVDVEDDEEQKNSVAGASTDSFQKISAPSSGSFTFVNKTNTEGHSQAPDSAQKGIMTEEVKSLAADSNLSENEVAKLLERRKKTRFDYEQVTDMYKKAEVLETGEVKLPNGKILGHRQWAREYKQNLNLRDAKEELVMKKLGIEYKKMGNTSTAVQHFNPESIMKKFRKNKHLHTNKKYDLKLGIQGNKVKATHFRLQYL